MEAKMNDSSNGSGFNNHILEEQILLKEALTELKYEILDLRKDLKHEISLIKTMHEHSMEQSYKAIEMRMYQFMTKAIITAGGLLGAIQSFFIFFK